jgi:hypothetical protein
MRTCPRCQHTLVGDLDEPCPNCGHGADDPAVESEDEPYLVSDGGRDVHAETTRLCPHCESGATRRRSGSVHGYQDPDGRWYCNNCNGRFEAAESEVITKDEAPGHFGAGVGGSETARTLLDADPDEVGRDQDDELLVTDGGAARAINETREAARVWHEDLSAFQRDLLRAISTKVEPHGLALKEALAEFHREEIHHGRLYPNLDELVDDGLVEKGELDARTNSYELTAWGETVLGERDALLDGGA